MIILALARSTFEVVDPDDGTRALALSRISLYDPPDPESARSKIETVGAGPLGLAAPEERVEAHLALISDGVEVAGVEGAFVGDVEVTSSPEGSTWRLNVPGYTGSERLGEAVIGFPGRIMTFGGAPSRVVDIVNRINFDGTLQTYPLVTAGRLDDLTQPLTGHRAEPVSGGDYLSNFNDVKVEFKKAAGVEKNHGEIIIDVLLLAGIPAERIQIDPSAGRPLRSLFELTCADGSEAVPAARRIAASFGHFLAVTLDGNVVLRHMAPVDEPPLATIGTDLFELDEVEHELRPPPRRVKQCYLVTGSRPAPSKEGEGLETVGPLLVSETIELFSKPIAQFLQVDSTPVTGGTLNPLDPTGFLPPVETITAQTFVTEIFREGCLVQKITTSWAFKNPEVPRYETAGPTRTADGTPFSYRVGVFIFTAGAVKDDQALTFAWNSPRFVPIEIKQEDFFRDEIRHVPLSSDDPVGTNQAEGWRGRELKTIVFQGKWRLDETPWKQRDLITDPWDAALVRANLPLRGSGAPIEGREALFSGPDLPDSAVLGGAYPPIGGAPIFGIEELGSYSRASWSTVESSESDAFNPQEADVYFTSAELTAARAIPKPGSFKGVQFDDNEFLDSQRSRFASFTPTGPFNPTTAEHEIRMFPDRPAGWLSKTIEEDQGWDRKPPPGGATNFQWTDETASKDATLIGRVLQNRVHNFVPEGNSHRDLVTITDGEGNLLPSTSVLGQGFSPVPAVCMPEIDALESISIEGLCCNFANTTFVDGIERVQFDFGIETADAAADLACILQRADSAAVALISLPNIVSIFYSGAPVEMAAVLKGIDLALYQAIRPGALSNAWAEDVSYSRLRNEETNEQKKLTVISFRVAVT